MATEGGASLGEYLVRLAREPRLAKEFRENPERAMAAAGISEPDRDLLLSGSAEAVRQAILQDLGEGNVELIVWTWPITWPIVWP